MPDATLLSARLRVAVLAAHAALFTALLAAGLLAGSGAVVALALPLLLPLRGLWLGRPYTYAWSSMLLVFYLGALLLEATANPARRPLALALAVIAAIEFCALMLYVRARAVEARRAG
jgi:uncharacterized membrane protein